jgi:hypothetical protein
MFPIASGLFLADDEPWSVTYKYGPPVSWQDFFANTKGASKHKQQRTTTPKDDGIVRRCEVRARRSEKEREE